MRKHGRHAHTQFNEVRQKFYFIQSHCLIINVGRRSIYKLLRVVRIKRRDGGRRPRCPATWPAAPGPAPASSRRGPGPGRRSATSSRPRAATSPARPSRARAPRGPGPTSPGTGSRATTSTPARSTATTAGWRMRSTASTTPCRQPPRHSLPAACLLSSSTTRPPPAPPRL